MIGPSLRAWIGAGSALLLGGCALIWGFEEHEPFPPEGQGGNGGSPVVSSSSTTGGSMMMSSSAVGGGGGSGGVDPGVAVALITEAFTGAIGAYSRADGQYLGDWLPPFDGSVGFEFSFPVVATEGPDGFIYVVDNGDDTIYRFTKAGEFDSVFVDADDGLASPQTIAFRGSEAFVPVDTVSADPAILRFGLDGAPMKPDFVENSASAQDIVFLSNGTMLSVTGEDPEELRLYDVVGGTSNFNVLTTTDSPQQLYAVPTGNILLAESDNYREITLGGVSVATHSANAGIGMLGLDNGNWMVTDVLGILEISPADGSTVETVRVGSGFWRIGVAVLDELPSP